MIYVNYLFSNIFYYNLYKNIILLFKVLSHILQV